MSQTNPINPKSSVSDVQDCMNNARGELVWTGKKNKMWLLLLEVRNSFVRERLLRYGQSSTTLKLISTHMRYYIIAQIEKAFLDDFFSYSREDEARRSAVGDVDSWIKIEGMAGWHVQKAISALENSDSPSAGEPSGSASAVNPPVKDNSSHYDAVKEAAEKNKYI